MLALTEARNLEPGTRSPKPETRNRVEMCSGSQAGWYLRLIDSCFTQLKAQAPSRTCNESKEEEEENAKTGSRFKEAVASCVLSFCDLVYTNI